MDIIAPGNAAVSCPGTVYTKILTPSYDRLTELPNRRLLMERIEDKVHHNAKPKPFIWTKGARDLLQKVIPANSRLSSKQNETLH
jgi:hypothetical protein